MNYVHVKLNTYFDFSPASNTKSLKIRLIIRCKYESAKVCFQKITYQIRHNKCFLTRKVSRMSTPWAEVLNDKETIDTFCKQKLKI